MSSHLYQVVSRRFTTLWSCTAKSWSNCLEAVGEWRALFGLSPALVGSDYTWELGWNGILMAAPKKRTSHSKKRLRMTHKWPQNKENIEVCFYCGRPKLMNILCKHCLEETLKETEKLRKKIVR